ncbi:MAG TPA: substrate-binding domain-containing protein [Pseudolabrys sp.]|nr:substrate-binding domain-containing protein [Pseudolabrys sp.]
MPLFSTLRVIVTAGLVIAAGTLAQAQTTAELPAIPKGKETDVKFYGTDNAVVTGRDAFERMDKADVTLWVAGNQFFAMDDVIGTYRARHPKESVGLITLPPGLLLQAIKAGGWTYEGTAYRGRPDIYASVNLGHLRALKSAGLMQNYSIYMHNELQIMVAKGNPKQIAGIKDLARADVRTSMPNPINEGIMQFYARKVLERNGVWQAISGGKECVSCPTTPNNWFTAVHHRETPARIKAGQSDAGIVWKTEVLAALRAGAAIEAVTLPDDDSLRTEVSYAIGRLSDARHADAAERVLAFLRSPAGQDTYAKYGFVKASAEDLAPKPIP